MNISIFAEHAHLAGTSASVRNIADPEPAPEQAPAATPVTLTPGTYYLHEGGIYIGQMPARGAQGAYHLFAATSEHEGLAFGPSVDIAGAASHWDGLANTMALLASKEAHPAAQWAAAHTADDKRDWYLPAHAELMLAFVNCTDKFKPEGWYWSSTQHGRSTAWIQDFEHGYSDYDDKDGVYRVRAFRRSFI